MSISGFTDGRGTKRKRPEDNLPPCHSPICRVKGRHHFIQNCNIYSDADKSECRNKYCERKMMCVETKEADSKTNAGYVNKVTELRSKTMPERYGTFET